MDSSEETASDTDLFDKKYEDLDAKYNNDIEIKQVADYAQELSGGVFLAGNGLSISYSGQFKQENFDPPTLPWRKSTIHAVVDFLLDEGNISKEDMWKEFSNMLHKLFLDAFISPILSAHRDYDPTKIQIYTNKLMNYNQIYTLNYDLLLPWTGLPDVKYVHGNINLMFSGDPPEEERTLQDYGINIYQNFTDQILENILEVRQRDDIVFTEVYGGNHYEKLYHIYSCQYLQDQFESLSSISGNLILFGCSVSANDKHLWEKIDSNDNITWLWISIHEESKINELHSKVNTHFQRLTQAGKVKYFDPQFFF